MSKAAIATPSKAGAFWEVPAIDLAPFRQDSEVERAAVAREVGRVCETVGFLYVRNHGVEQCIIDDAFAESRRFFALPAARKRDIHVARMPNHRGFIGAAEETVDLTAASDIKEAFKFGRDMPADDPMFLAGNRLFGPNAWPPDLPSFRTAIEAYVQAMLGLSETFYRLFALSLDLPEDYLLRFADKPMDIGNLLYYPAQTPRPGQPSGVGSHTDTNGFTILAQVGVGGLEIANQDGEWIAAPPVPGTFVINIGSMLAHWTNDRFAATRHRVRNVSGQERYSIAYFASCNYDTMLTCLPTCLRPGEPPRYRPVRAGEYLTDLLTATHDYLQSPVQR
jgi:isopenicillin N synthase-like dioxygenase